MDANQVLERTKTIQEAFEKFGSDKAEHGYAEFYAKYLPKNPLSILEIGVKEGNSIRAWKHLFPDAFICGYDLFEEFPIPKIDGVLFVKGNQRDVERLTDIGAMIFDVIIDDGSHNSRDQLISFFALAKKGIHYFIEDTHCNDDDFYSQNLPNYFRPKEILSLFNLIENKGQSQIMYIPC